MQFKEQVVVGGQVGPGFMSAAYPAVLRTCRYFARSLVDGSPSAAAMFDELVDFTEAWLTSHHPGEIEDPRGYAAILVAMETGLLAMHAQLSRSLGSDIFSPAGHLRMARAKIDFYSYRLVSPELAAQVRGAIDVLQARQPAAGPEPQPGGGSRGGR